MVDRAKVRVVAMGYSQVEGVDYFEAFALRPVLLLTGWQRPWQAGLGPEALRCRPGLHSVGIGHRYLHASTPGLWISIWQGSAPQQGSLRPEVEQYLGSEYKRDREKVTLEISQIQVIRSVLNRFYVSKSSPVPAAPSLDPRPLSEETVEDVPFCEIVGSLMWIANQTRPDVVNAVPAIARFSHDPKANH